MFQIAARTLPFKCWWSIQAFVFLVAERPWKECHGENPRVMKIVEQFNCGAPRLLWRKNGATGWFRNDRPGTMAVAPDHHVGKMEYDGMMSEIKHGWIRNSRTTGGLNWNIIYTILYTNGGFYGSLPFLIARGNVGYFVFENYSHLSRSRFQKDTRHRSHRYNLGNYREDDSGVWSQPTFRVDSYHYIFRIHMYIYIYIYNIYIYIYG